MGKGGVTRWMKLSVDFYTDDKLEQLSNDQLLLFIKMVAWSVQHDTDGRIPLVALGPIARKHQRTRQAIAKMVSIRLLDRCCSDAAVIEDRCCSDAAVIVKAFRKWQLVSDESKPKHAGQERGEGLPRAGAGAGTENRTEQISSYLLEDSLAPAVEVVHPGMRATLERLGQRMNGTKGEH